MRNGCIIFKRRKYQATLCDLAVSPSNSRIILIETRSPDGLGRRALKRRIRPRSDSRVSIVPISQYRSIRWAEPNDQIGQMFKQSHDLRQNKINKQIGRNVCGKSPQVSIIIPAFNVSDHIAETLDSVAAQTFRDFEVIVVNDGSPDTEQLERTIAPYREEITYITQNNAGAGVARNTGIECARGEIIAFLDGDDIWLPDYLASQTDHLARHGLDMLYCDAILFGMHSGPKKTYMESAPSRGEVDFDALLDLRCNVITSGTVVRKQVIADAGAFEPEMVKAEDFHLWLRIAKAGAKIGFQRKQLLKYRVDVASLSGDLISRIERSIDAFERVCRTIELTPKQRETAERRIVGFKADLDVAKGKVSLLKSDFQAAAEAFRAANRKRRSFKMTAVALLAYIAPRTLQKHYQNHRSDEFALIRDHKRQDVS